MIQSDRTIVATAQRAEVDAHRYNREENIPKKWLGIHATWRECRLFDWSYLAAQFRRSGDSEMEGYTMMRATEWSIK